MVCQSVARLPALLLLGRLLGLLAAREDEGPAGGGAAMMVLRQCEDYQEMLATLNCDKIRQGANQFYESIKQEAQEAIKTAATQLKDYTQISEHLPEMDLVRLVIEKRVAHGLIEELKQLLDGNPEDQLSENQIQEILDAIKVEKLFQEKVKAEELLQGAEDAQRLLKDENPSDPNAAWANHLAACVVDKCHLVASELSMKADKAGKVLQTRPLMGPVQSSTGMLGMRPLVSGLP
eukprot:CAMPEP_0168437192 /NCGR_PEP_ID=MMETSP0228-20121227/41309_1 /TAXON_ID=133427 /ORGANISM="Protoceratium reticulatum, Strain CCCM 535 (=CCMP 1889)" /LENGTH=234 /DNA_ID=CAMNT_0008451401 /DNA_START=43 /DNA_END=744 /DNA_ORIENTATION=+